MSSVTQRIKQIKQPHGGYLKLKDWERIDIDDGSQLFPEENIHASLVGLAVDYLSRCAMGTNDEEAFKISLLGAQAISDSARAYELLDGVQGTDDHSIVCACKLAGYDVCARAGVQGYRPVDEIEPNTETISNVRKMVERSFKFFHQYGPVTKDGFTFEGGYTAAIDCGDGDFLTEDTLWDFKVSNSGPKPAHTLQVLVYYIMGLHSTHPEFASIKKLGIFNPRLNRIYRMDISQIDPEIINQVSSDVIGYSAEVTAQKVHVKRIQEWTLADLSERYGVSKQKIIKDFLACGLPYHKVGNAYRFIPDRVIDWEILQRSVPYGKNEKLMLPAYLDYGEELKSRLKEAKEADDREEIAWIKREMRENGYTDYSWRVFVAMAIVLAGFFCMYLYILQL